MSGSPRPAEAIQLRFVDEAQHLVQLDLAALAETDAPPPAGAIASLLAAGGQPDEEMQQELAARSGGPGRPESPSLWFSREASVCRVGEAWHLPRLGAVIDGAGHVFRSTASGARCVEVMAGAPGVSLGVSPGGDADLVFHPPADAPRLPPSTVFVAWGGGFN